MPKRVQLYRNLQKGTNLKISNNVFMFSYSKYAGLPGIWQFNTDCVNTFNLILSFEMLHLLKLLFISNVRLLMLCAKKNWGTCFHSRVLVSIPSSPLPSFRPAFLPACQPASQPACLPACLSLCLPACMPASLPACLFPSLFLSFLLLCDVHLIHADYNIRNSRQHLLHAVFQ